MSATSVVVVTVKPELHLDRCLARIADEAAQVVVVDNGSGGETARRLAHRYGATLVHRETNEGFAHGVNVGVRAATQDHVALLNDDAFPEPGWLEGSERALRDPTVGAVVPKLLFDLRRGVVRLDDPVRFHGRDWRPYGRRVRSITVGEYDFTADALAYGVLREDDDDHAFWTHGASTMIVPLPAVDDEVRVNGERVEVEATFDVVNNAGTFLHPAGWCGDVGYGARDDGSFDRAEDRFAACAAALVTRRETWERVGPFADEFFTYYEDTDWSWRLQLAGLRVRYEPALVVRHAHASTAEEGSRWWRFFVERNRILCFARNAPARVVARVLSRLPPLPDGVVRSLAWRVPQALGSRRAIARCQVRSPEDVWAQWAGIDLPQ